MALVRSLDQDLVQEARLPQARICTAEEASSSHPKLKLVTQLLPVRVLAQVQAPQLQAQELDPQIPH